MQLSELRKRVYLTRGVTAFRGDEGLIPDARGNLRPVDCIEQKLDTLLTDETAVVPPKVNRANGATREVRVARRTFK
jgi:hypothetical protein